MNPNQTLQQHILNTYDIAKKLGSGAYGHVWKVIQKSTKKIYALKKIFEAFQNATDAQRTFRQISILMKISHKNIIQLHQVFLGKNGRDVYLIFQYMETDLYHTIYQNILQSIHKKFVLYQLLVGTQYIHEVGLIHRDLKPSNILVDSNCNSKICDFGLARLIKACGKQNNVMTEGVATRWYRAPQVLLGSNCYGQEADIWSIGCIMAEILIKNPMFPGSSTINQLQKILQFTGKPNQQDLRSIQCQYAQKFIEQCGNVKLKSSKQFFGTSNPQMIDLIYRILQFNPSKRLLISQILKHEYFSQFYQENDLKFGIKRKIQLEINDNIKLTTQQYKSLIEKFDQSKNSAESQRVSTTEFNTQRADSVRRGDHSPLNEKRKAIESRIQQISLSKSPQRFQELKKMRDSSFNKVPGSEKIKKRSDSRDEIEYNRQKRKPQLFSELIKNKDSTNHDRRSGSQVNDKQNFQSNNIVSNSTNNVNLSNCLKRFENINNTSRISFQGLKKTANIKFNR